MPFQSEQQRKYLWANEPEIAKRWEKYPKGYNTGGVSHLFRSKEAVHGGYIRPEDSGVLGLADGGRTGFFTGMREQEQKQQDRQTRGPRDDPDRGGGAPPKDPTPDSGDGGNVPPSMRGGAPDALWTPPATPKDDKGDGDAREKYISEQYTSPEALDAKRRRDLRNLVNRQEEEKRDYVAPPKKKSLLGALATAIAWYTGLAPLLGLKVPAVVQTLGTGFKMKSQLEYGLKKYNKQFGTNYNLDEFIAKTTDRLKKEHAERQEKMALYKSLPDGHPEKIALSIELEIGKKPEHLGDRGGGVEIMYDDITKTNEHKDAVRASGETMDLLYAPTFEKEEDRSKQMAYWQSLMAPYMGGAMGMAAEGGRVPGGYNTGGLSNLFRLKNK